MFFLEPIAKKYLVVVWLFFLLVRQGVIGKFWNHMVDLFNSWRIHSLFYYKNLLQKKSQIIQPQCMEIYIIKPILVIKWKLW